VCQWVFSVLLRKTSWLDGNLAQQRWSKYRGVIHQDLNLYKGVGNRTTIVATKHGQTEKVKYKLKPQEHRVRGCSQKRKKWKSPNHQFWARMKYPHKWEPGRWWDLPGAGYIMATANLNIGDRMTYLCSPSISAHLLVFGFCLLLYVMYKLFLCCNIFFLVLTMIISICK
jgi:hypothetical protein